jgi:hypothetical protein
VGQHPAAKIESPALQPGDIPDRAYQLRSLEKVKIEVGGHEFEAWLMDTDAKREEGFMYVKDSEVKPNEAMVFAFPDSKQRGFWMKNCPMALDIAFFGPDKRLLNVGYGKPFSEANVPSDGSSQYVVEAKAGTFKRLGIRAGAKLEAPASVMALE